jgi:hypothetical protein
LLRLSLVAPEARETHCGAEFPGLGLLLTGDGEGALEIGFRIRSIQLGRPQCDFTGNAIYLSLTPFFLSYSNGGDRFVDATPSIVEFSEFRIALANVDKYQGMYKVVPVER